MSARDDVPAEIRRMRTSELVECVSLRSLLAPGTLGPVITKQLREHRAHLDACAAELDRRIPPSEGS